MTQIYKFPFQALITVAIGLLVVAGWASRSVAQDGTTKADPPSKQRYTAGQLNKLQTLQLVASSTNARTERLYRNILPFLTHEQQRQCRRIVVSYGQDFDRLRDQRNQIMANASDQNGTPEKLLDWRSRTLDLAKKIRRDLRKNVLTEQQEKDYQREVKRQEALKAAKAKAVAAENASLKTNGLTDVPSAQKVEQP